MIKQRRISETKTMIINYDKDIEEIIGMLNNPEVYKVMLVNSIKTLSGWFVAKDAGDTVIMLPMGIDNINDSVKLIYEDEDGKIYCTSKENNQ